MRDCPRGHAARCPILPCAGEGDEVVCRVIAQMREKQAADSQPREPSLLAKAASLTRTVVGHLADGCRATPPEFQAERRAICEACPHLDAARNSCRICGCHLDAKRAMASQRCPIGRWEAV